MPDAPVTGKPVTLDSLKHFFGNKKTLMFLVLIFISSVPARMNDTFIGVYIRELGGSPQLVGQSFFLAAISEIIVFALSFWWLRKGKELIIISISGAFYFLRFLISAWIIDPHLLAYLQILQILTFLCSTRALFNTCTALYPRNGVLQGKPSLHYCSSVYQVSWLLMLVGHYMMPLGVKLFT